MKTSCPSDTQARKDQNRLSPPELLCYSSQQLVCELHPCVSALVPAVASLSKEMPNQEKAKKTLVAVQMEGSRGSNSLGCPSVPNTAIDGFDTLVNSKSCLHCMAKETEAKFLA